MSENQGAVAQQKQGKDHISETEAKHEEKEIESLSDLRNFIKGDIELSLIAEKVEKQLENDPGHDIHHAYRVALWTIRLSPAVKKRNTVAASLFHDYVNIPKNDPRRSIASELSANEARTFLWSSCATFSAADVEDIYLAIRDHSFSRGAVPETDLGKALQDADRLEALGVLGAFRNISCGTQMGAEFFNAEDPWRESNRDLDDKNFSMDHYSLKLFKLQHTMNTKSGKAEAFKRTKRMRQMLADLGDEIGFPYPTEASLNQ